MIALYKKRKNIATVHLILCADDLSEYWEFQECNNRDGFDKLMELGKLDPININDYPSASYDISKDKRDNYYFKVRL